jgi:hypothetical protein
MCEYDSVDFIIPKINTVLFVVVVVNKYLD